MSDSIEMEDELKITVYHPLYMFFPTQLAALHKLKKEIGPTNAIDLLFISVFTTYIESVLSEMFYELIEKKMGESSDSFTKRMADQLINEIDKGTWSTYQQKFEIVFGKSIIYFVPEPTIKAIAVLYTYRNQTIHGKRITHEITNRTDDTENTSLSGRYQNINAYFLGNKLVSKDELASLVFINDRILEHFNFHINTFSIALAEKVMKPEDLKMYETFKIYVLDKMNSSAI